jgi:IS30 family transposase
MRIFNAYSGAHIKGLDLISPEINIKDEFIKRRKKQYGNFKDLLEHNRTAKKGSGNKLTIKKIGEITGLSKSEYYRIGKKLDRGNWNDIERKSTKPHNYRKSKIPLETKELILKIRLENMTYGKTKIKVILERDYDITLGSGSINKILNEYKTKDKIPKYSPSQTLKKRHRRFDNTHAQKWDYNKHCLCNKDKKSLGKIDMGELIQIDHMTVTKNNVVIKQFTAIDPTTRFIVSEVYSNATSFTAMKFLIERVINGFPFRVKSIQTDGGSEFMKYFEETCKEHNIPLYILPPHKPKYNGRVERSNRIMREEFYMDNELLKLTDSLGAFRNKLKEFIDKYNNYRPHKELDYLTPREYYNRRMVKADEFVS